MDAHPNPCIPGPHVHVDGEDAVIVGTTYDQKHLIALMLTGAQAGVRTAVHPTTPKHYRNDPQDSGPESHT